MRTHGTKIKCPCVFSTLQSWRGNKMPSQVQYLWFLRLHALLLSENNSWKPEGTFIHQHGFASSGMKDKVASPDYVLLIICLLSPKIVHQKPSQKLNSPTILSQKYFSLFFTLGSKRVFALPLVLKTHLWLRCINRSSLTVYHLLLYMLTLAWEIQHHRYLVDIVISDASVLTLYSYFPTLIFQQKRSTFKKNSFVSSIQPLPLQSI